MIGKETPSVLKLLVLVLPIAAVMFVAGCTTPSGIAMGPGVAILDWAPDHASVESRDEVQLRLQIQNQGGEQADNVRALLTVITFGDDEWIFGGIQSQPYQPLSDYLISPNPRYGTDGEKAEYIWYLYAPKLPEGITQTYSPRVRIFYNYMTTAVKPVTIVNDDELRHLTDIGGSLPSQASQHSGGPLSVSVVTGKHIKIDSDSGNKVFPITIHIENTGGGIPYWVSSIFNEYTIPEDKEYKINLGMQLPPGLAFADECANYASAGGPSGSVVQLWKGRSADLTCKLLITHPPAVAQEGTIKLYLYYGYAIDRSTSITVKGIEGG